MRIEQYNAAHEVPGVIEQVVVYAGQSVIDREPANGGEREESAVWEEGERT